MSINSIFQQMCFSIKSLVSMVVAISPTLLVYACASNGEVDISDARAVVTTTTENGCDRPAIRIDGIVETESGRKVAFENRFGPISLKPGRYAISVACQNPLDEAVEKCVFWGHSNEYPTYNVSLIAGIKYTFHCFVEGQELSYRISESVL